MKPRYRSARRHGWIWVLTFVIGNVVGLGVGYLLQKQLGGLSFVITVAIILVSLWAGYAFISRKDKGRRKEIGQLLQSKGYTFEMPLAANSFGAFQFLEEWGGWSEWIANNELKWLALREGHLLMEREFVVGENDSYAEYNNTIGIVLHPGCTQLKGLRVARAKAAKRPLETGDQQFDREWVVAREGDDPVKRNLSPATREALSRCPFGESWYFGSGWAMCEFPAFLDAKNINSFEAHLDEVVRSISI